MLNTWKTRLQAAVMGIAVLTTSLAATPVVWAANKTVSVNQTLEVAIAGSDGTASNAEECTYTGLLKNYPTSGITSLQFNLTASTNVVKFTYYFGISASESQDYWWDGGGSVDCYPGSDSFSVAVDLKKADINYYDDVNEWAIGADWNESRHLEFQNCYAEDEEGNKIPVTLTSVVVNGTTDTTSSEAPEGYGGSEDKEAQYPNTGDAGFYSSQNTQSGNYSFVDNKDGTATITATITKKITAEEMTAYAEENYGTDKITLTPSPKGADYSEEVYTDPDDDTKVMRESEIRKAGYPLNSHRFYYEDFGITADSDTAKIIPEALTVVLRGDADENVTRVMYGGGLNVYGSSVADTESAKTVIGRDSEGNVVDSSLAGFKADKNSGYWYNDIGADNYDEVLANLKEYGGSFGVTVQNGKDVKDQNFGDYVQVTWDIPEDVKDYADVKLGNSISFQLWYGEIESDEYTALTSLDLESAMLTYTEVVTFPYQNNSKITAGDTLTVGGSPASYEYADFNMTYENTADVYAVLFTLDTKVDARQLVLGTGTSVLAKKSSTYWYQADDNGSSIALVSADDNKKEYTYMWVMPQAVAKSYKYNQDGSVTVSGSVENYVSTEQEGDNFKIGLYYADDADATAIKSATVKDVTVYYTTDDKTNSAKSDMFEKDLTVSPKNITLEVGDTKKIVTNVTGSSFVSSDEEVATVDENGNVTGVGGGQVTITVTTPKGQTAEVVVTVNAVTTTTEPFEPLYGDTNLDGIVDLRDAVTLNRYLANLVTFSDQAMENADVEYDHNVDDLDSSKLVQYLIFLVTQLGPES